VLSLDSPRGGPLDLDTRDLEIQAVETADGQPIPHALHAPMPILGSRLRAELPAGTAAVRIRYRTTPRASALPGLSPAQTAGVARAGAALAGVGGAVAGGRRRARVLAGGRDDPRRGEAVRPVRLGPLRRADHAAFLPLRRDGEPAAHLHHAHGDRRRQVAGER